MPLTDGGARLTCAYRTAGCRGGIVVAHRHSHAVLLAVPALWGLGAGRSLASQVHALWNRRRNMLLAGLVAGLIVLPQLAIYHAVTGHWIISPYALIPGAQTLHAPRVWDVWFSTQKGLFFWSPLLPPSIAGLCLRHPLVRGARWSVVTAFLLISVLIGSWHDWQFGGSYGHRGFTDVLPLLAIPIAGVIAWTSRAPAPVRATMSVISVVIVSLSSVPDVAILGRAHSLQRHDLAAVSRVFLRWR